jgi:peptidoglycan/xylan/chitin deacetylase (PgdA/CDA1 family)
MQASAMDDDSASVYGKRGAVVRVAYLAGALGAWIVSGFGRFGPRGTVVLCYHGVTRAQRPAFEWQMRRLAGRATSVTSLAGATASGRRNVCVTFDDAFACLLENALPVMRRHGIAPTVFAVTGNLGRTPQWSIAPTHPEAQEIVMTAAEIERAAAGGCHFGSHTVNHVDLAAVPPARLREELTQSKAVLERMLGGPVEDFALPFGSYNGDVLAAALAAGYRRTFTLEPAVADDSHVARGAIGRFSMSPDVWRVEFLLTCVGAYAWLGVFRRLVRRMRAAPRRPAAKEAAT